MIRVHTLNYKINMREMRCINAMVFLMYKRRKKQYVYNSKLVNKID